MKNSDRSISVSSGNAPEYRQYAADRGLAHQAHATRAIGGDGNQPGRFDGAQIAVHRAARGDAEVCADLAQLGRHAVAVRVGAHKVVYLTFPVGQHNGYFCAGLLSLDVLLLFSG
jgi:hypothetical protein